MSLKRRPGIIKVDKIPKEYFLHLSAPFCAQIQAARLYVNRAQMQAAGLRVTCELRASSLCADFFHKM